MIPPTISLRSRLMVLILIPLTVISLLAGLWRFAAATETAQGIFDRRLIALTLAISRDVAVSEGGVLSPFTIDMLRDTSGGGFFIMYTGPTGLL